MDKFRYQRLETRETIRLLHLHPGKNDELISCHLRHVSLNKRPEYEGLSYMWGDSNSKQTLICNNVEARVTSNLHDALHHFRELDREVVLWANQICINQSDIEERGQQVSIMGYIYSYSQRCIAFLGNATESDMIAATFMDEIRRGWEYDLKSKAYRPSTSDAFKVSMDDTRWQKVFGLFSKPWFSRVWIIQEAVLAPDCLMHIGNYFFNLTHLQRILFLINQSRFGIASMGDGTKYLRVIVCLANLTNLSKFSQGGPETRITRILRNSRTTFATDPRDKVYALLELAHDLNTGIIQDDKTET